MITFEYRFVGLPYFIFQPADITPTETACESSVSVLLDTGPPPLLLTEHRGHGYTGTMRHVTYIRSAAVHT